MREMKNSGIEWIGEIPVGWEINKIGSVYDERSVKVSDKEYAPLSVTKQGIVPQLETAAKTDNGDNRKLIKKGDFVINSRSDRRGSCGISEYDGSCSLINTVLQPRKNMCNTYYSFVFRSECFADEFYRWGTGIVDDLWSTKWSNMKNIYIPFPPLEEQQKLSTYLDNKCEKIDSIIARQQEVIEKLKAYKLSVITEAVTKGLNPDVKMKDSGVEWIGEVPENCKVTRVGHIFNIILGKMLSPTPKQENDTLENYLCAANVHFTDISYKPLKQMWFSETEKEIYKVKYGDLLVVEGGAGAGGAHIVDIKINDCYIQNSIMIVRPNGEISNKWLNYTLYALVKRNYIDFVCNKATIPHFTKEKLSNVPVVIFSKENEVDIINYLDKKCSAIDSAITKKQALIEKLTEYKKSLIYEVVTGKKEV